MFTSSTGYAEQYWFIKVIQVSVHQGDTSERSLTLLLQHSSTD